MRRQPLIAVTAGDATAVITVTVGNANSVTLTAGDAIPAVTTTTVTIESPPTPLPSRR